MGVVCESCGHVGYKHLLLRCSNCKDAARHRYCLDAVIYESIVEWMCNDCLPKHNEATKSLEDVSNQRPLRDTQLGSSIINESNVKKNEVTKGLLPWVHRRNRSCKGRKDRSDASTKHFFGGDTFNSGHRVNRSHKEGSDSSDPSTKQSRSGDVLNSCEMFIGEMSKCNDSETKGEDRNEHLMCALGSVDGSSHSALDHASEIEEHNHFQDPMGKPTFNSMECPDLSKEKDSCFSSSKYVEGFIPQERKGDISSLIDDVERPHPMIADKSHPTLASLEQADGSSPTLASMEKSHPFKAVKGLVYKQKSVLASKFPPNHSKPMQGSDMKTGNGEALNPSKECFDSWSKVAEPSSPSNEREDSTVEKDSAERTKCVTDEEIVIRTLENRMGSNPSTVKECWVSNEGNPDEANRRPDEPFLSTKDEKIRKKMSGEVYRICDDPTERGNSWKVNEISNPKSAEGDQDGRNLKCNVGKTSSPAGKKVARKQVLQVESINSESLSSKYVSPCESTKINPRTRHNESNSHTPYETKYQTFKLIKKNRNVYSTRSKSGRPAASLKDNQNMHRKNNGSNGKVIERSKLGKDKKRDESWLANKTISDLQKRGMVTSVLQPSSLHGSSGKMDVVPKESSCQLNDRRSSCARRVRKMDQMERSKRSDHTNTDAFLEVSSKTKKVHVANDAEPKKRRRLILSYDEYEDDEAMQLEDLNPRSCDNDGQLKKQRTCTENAVNHKEVKKQRSVEANQDQNAVLGYPDAGCSQNDVSQLALQTVLAEDRCSVSRMPLMSEYICVQPIEKPYWTGIMKIGMDYIPLAGHLSNKAGKKVQELSRSLPPIMKATELSMLKASPKRLEAPTADSIGLYFFSGDMRPNKELDQLVKHVADNGIVLETAVGFAKLLLFPSVVLPEEYQMFQGKHYLWGAFQPKSKGFAPVEKDCMAHVTEEEQHVFNQQDKSCLREQHGTGPRTACHTKDCMAQVQEQHIFNQQDKAQQCDTLDQEMPLANQVACSENQSLPLLDANQDVGKEALSGNGPPSAEMKAPVPANISPADHGQPCSNPEAPPLKLCGFVISRTPKTAQLIHEMQKEGALLFAVERVLTEPGSVL